MPPQSGPPQSVTTPRPAKANARATTSLWRLRGYLNPYRWRLAVMLSTALAGVLVALAIPLVTRRLIDGPIAHSDRSGIWLLGALALALGMVEALLVLIRRWVQARAVLGGRPGRSGVRSASRSR